MSWYHTSLTDYKSMNNERIKCQNLFHDFMPRWLIMIQCVIYVLLGNRCRSRRISFSRTGEVERNRHDILRGRRHRLRLLTDCPGSKSTYLVLLVCCYLLFSYILTSFEVKEISPFSRKRALSTVEIRIRWLNLRNSYYCSPRYGMIQFLIKEFR